MKKMIDTNLEDDLHTLIDIVPMIRKNVYVLPITMNKIITTETDDDMYRLTMMNKTRTTETDEDTHHKLITEKDANALTIKMNNTTIREKEEESLHKPTVDSTETQIKTGNVLREEDDTTKISLLCDIPQRMIVIQKTTFVYSFLQLRFCVPF